MQKLEAKFHTKLVKWLRNNPDKMPASYLIETKVSRGKSFPYRELSKKEERLLLRAKHGKLITTHSDYGQMGTDCDGACVSGGGFIFLQYVRRGNKLFYIIDIDMFLRTKNSSKRKSLEEWRAAAIAHSFGTLA